MQPNNFESSVNEFIAYRLETVAKVRPDEYVLMPNMHVLDPRVLADSMGWAQKFFVTHWNPYVVSPPPARSIHVARSDTYDLLKHEYELHGTRVAVLETKAFAMIKVATPSVDRLLRMVGSEQLAEVTRIGLSMLNVTDPWRRRAPSSKDESAAFSTNPALALVTMSSWDERIEAGVYRGELYFLCHKKVSQLLGFESSRHWFSDEFRAKHAGSNR
jgi:hypothetical protein